MSNVFQGIGKVGDPPRLTTVLVGSEERQVAELRVFFDDYRQDGKGLSLIHISEPTRPY